MKHRKHTPETIEKMRQAQKRRWERKAIMKKQKAKINRTMPAKPINNLQYIDIIDCNLGDFIIVTTTNYLGFSFETLARIVRKGKTIFHEHDYVTIKTFTGQKQNFYAGNQTTVKRVNLK